MPHSGCAIHEMAAYKDMCKGQLYMAAPLDTQLVSTQSHACPSAVACTKAWRILHGSPVSDCGVAGLQECGACTKHVSLPKHCPFPCRSHPSSGRRWDALGKASAARNKGIGQKALTRACATACGMCWACQARPASKILFHQHLACHISTLLDWE